MLNRWRHLRMMLRNSGMLMGTMLLVVLAGMPVKLNAQAAVQLPAREVRLVLTVEEDDRAFIIADVASVKAAPSGDFYVLDRKEADIKMFNARGAFVRRIGRRGAGPGELTGPSLSLDVDAREIRVTDHMLRRDVVFDLNGKHLRTTNHATLDNAIRGSVRPMRDRWSLAVSVPAMVVTASASKSDLFTRVMLHGPAGRVDTLAAFRSEVAEAQRVLNGKAGMTTSFNTGAGPSGTFVVSGDSMVVLVDGVGGQVRWVRVTASGPVVARVAQLPATGTAMPRRMLDSARAVEERTQQRLQPGVRLEVVDAPTMQSVVTRALVSSDGTLWVAGIERSSFVPWTVFPASGQPFAVRTPVRFRLTDVRGLRLYGHGLSADHVPHLTIYEFAR